LLAISVSFATIRIESRVSARDATTEAAQVKKRRLQVFDKSASDRGEMRTVATTRSIDYARKPLARPPFPRDLAVGIVLFVVFASLVLLGVWWLRRGGAMVVGNEMNIDRAVFTSVNAITLTGFQLSVAVESYKLPAQAMVLVLTIAGSLVSLIIGGLAVARLLEMHYTIRRVIVAALVAEAIAVVLGTAATARSDRPLLASALLAASSFGNSGLVIGSAGGVLDGVTHLLLMPLALFGGFGLTVLIEMYDWVANRRPISTHARCVLIMSAALYLAGFMALAGLRWPDVSLRDASFKSQLVSDIASASVQSINSRTAGLPLEYVGAWPRAAQWVVLVLMFIGASPAGTGGGLKTTTLYELGRGARATLFGRSPGRILGVALVWLFAYTIIIFLTMTLLLMLESALAGDRALFIAVSAAANVGLSPDPVSITGNGLYTLATTMLLGRVLPWAVLWWAALTTPEADIAVG
jgi:trk system potassium uptake protein TrkH